MPVPASWRDRHLDPPRVGCTQNVLAESAAPLPSWRMAGTQEWYGHRACAPSDRFFEANRGIAQQVWQRGDNGTVSQRVAEEANEAAGVPVRQAKTFFHALLAGAVGVGTAFLVSRVTRDPMAMAVGFAGAALATRKTFRYLEQDRCV